MEVKFIDLFAGTGGIRLAFESVMKSFNTSTVCVKSAEIDKKACETYQLNFNEDPYCDVTQLDYIENFDVLLAGFPCQAFSSAGKQLGFADTRGTLFFEVERLIEKYKPKVCFLENVRGLTTHDNGRTFRIIIESLKSQGYFVEYRLLNSSNYGVPQNRVRIYIVASLLPIDKLTLKSDVGASDSHKFKNRHSSEDLFGHNEAVHVSDILESNPDSKYDCSPEFVNKLKKVIGNDLTKLHGVRLIDSRNGNSIHSWELGIKGECTENEIEFMNMLVINRRKHVFGTHQDGKALTIEQIKTFYKNSDILIVINSLLEKGYLRLVDNDKYNLVCGNMSFEVFKFLDPNSVSITLTAADSQKLGIFHNGRVRRITPRECARLQGYPDDYILHSSDVSAYKQLGNAVSVPVVASLIEDYFKSNATFLTQKVKSNDSQLAPSSEHKVNLLS